MQIGGDRSSGDLEKYLVDWTKEELEESRKKRAEEAGKWGPGQRRERNMIRR